MLVRTAVRRASSAYKHIVVSRRGERVGVVQLDRPDAHNALSAELVCELREVLAVLDADRDVGAIVLIGNEKTFSAGADIGEMKSRSASQNLSQDYLSNWSFSSIRKPILAAVNGFALGGGCELAMMCDIVFAGTRAKFGQPEIRLGILPGTARLILGGGGTQRLVRAVGKSRAMEMILTGNMITAEEAERIGLVSRVFAPERLVEETIKIADTIASYSQIAVSLAKEAVNAAASFPCLFCNGKSVVDIQQDQKEGMEAFLEKRRAVFKNE